MTLIDIRNDRYEHVGTEDKKQAHRQGLWHRTFSALAVNPADRQVILQKKAPGRYCFDRPDYADFTVGGHYHAGEVPAAYATCAATGTTCTGGNLSRAELVPGYLGTDQLYLRMFIAARRYCAGGRTHLFW
ncbi:MAG: hypothetical protein ACRDNZ_05820 [Streptosporangiaceae bacterium]